MVFFGVKWGSMGSMWFAEVQCGSQGSLRLIWVL